MSVLAKLVRAVFLFSIPVLTLAEIGVSQTRPFKVGDRVEMCIDRVYQPNSCKYGTVISLGDGYFVKIQVDGENAADARFYNEDGLQKIGSASQIKSTGGTVKSNPDNGLATENGKVGECVNVDYHQDGKKMLLARVISTTESEPKYKVRFLSSGSFYPEESAYSSQVKPAVCGEDEWDPGWLIGPWSVVQGPTQVTSSPEYKADGSATVWTQTNLSGFGGNLGISANGTYLWIEDDKNVIKGNWVRSKDPNYALVLKKGRHGKDWNVWPTGKNAKGRKTMRIQTVGGGISLYGFQGK